MTLREYQKKAQETAQYPGKGLNLTYPVLGLCGEAGEVADKVKKVMRDNNGSLDGKRGCIAYELGDVLWYVTDLAVELGYSLEDVARMNIEKLSSRKARGVIGGSGDDR